MEEQLVVTTSKEIHDAVKKGARFRFAPTVTNLNFSAGLNVNYEHVAEALQQSTSIKYIRLKGSSLVSLIHRQPFKLFVLIEALHSSRVLESLTVFVDNDRTTKALGNLLKENSSLKDLSVVDGLNEIHHEFFDGLALNTSLSRLYLINRKWQAAQADKANEFLRKLVATLRNNDSISNFKLKTAVVSSEGEVTGYEEISTDKSFTIEQARHVVVKIERNVANPKRLIKNNNWEELAQYIKNNCTERLTKEMSMEDLNLNTRTFVDKLAIHSLKRLYSDTCHEREALELLVSDTNQQYQSLSSKLEALQRQMAMVEAEMNDANRRLVKYSQQLNEKKIVQERLGENMEAFQASLEKNEPVLQQWQQTLRTDVNEWNYDDVAFLLSEIGLEKYLTAFTTNKIDGAVLSTLDTNDLTATLDIAFKDAKKLLMYIYLIQTHRDIYVTPPGVLQWNNDTVCTWLEDNKFGHLVDVFKKHQINGTELVFLEKIDITHHLQIKALGDVVKLQKEISRLKDSLRNEGTLQDQLKNRDNRQEHNDHLEHQLEEMKRFNEELKMALKASKTKIPEAFICPITQDMMTDPVVASDGHTYERTAISLWLQNNNSSPMTGLQLSNKQLTPSHTLKSMIREFIDANKKK